MKVVEIISKEKAMKMAEEIRRDFNVAGLKGDATYLYIYNALHYKASLKDYFNYPC